MRCRCVVCGEIDRCTQSVGLNLRMQLRNRGRLKLTQARICLHAKGILLWFMLTGTLPFDVISPQELMEQRKLLQTSVLEGGTWMQISGACGWCGSVLV